MKKFYIFDLDGTLAASMKCWRRECAAENADDDAAWERVRQRMKKHYAEEIEIKAGVLDFLRAAKERGVDTMAAYELVKYPEAIRTFLPIPQDEAIVMGIALGYADGRKINGFRSNREPLGNVLTIQSK